MNNNFTLDYDKAIASLEPLLNETDFPMLREQKLRLLEEREAFRDRTATLYTVPPKMTELDDAVSGIIHFLDAFQDAAVAAGIPEHVVFGSLGTGDLW